MSAIVDLLKRGYHRLPKPPSSNYTYRKISPSPYELLPPHATIFDIGSKEARGSYAFGNPPGGARIVCVDILPGPGVDLVADAQNLDMVADESVDCIIAISALEHIRHPSKVIDEIFRILRPGGIVYINVPFVFPFHADPDDFYRFSHRGIAILCEKFHCIDTGFNRGPASTMHHLLVHFLSILFSFNSRTLYGLNVDLFGWLLFWVKYLDKIIGRYKMAYVIHSGAYFLGKKTYKIGVPE